jgi:hypothetical protein
MAKLMGILGGVGQGISAGVQDLERMDEAKFRKEQQQRERDKAAEEKRIAAQIKGIQAETPAEYDESMSTITKPAQKLSRAQMLARQADIYSSSPDRATAAYGLQLSQAARGEKEAEAVERVNTKYDEAENMMNTDLAKFQQTYPALFNADKFGGPETKGMIMAPMSTDKGVVYNVINPQGRSVAQIPVNKQSLGQALKAMRYSELERVNPKYAELAMKQEQIDLQREGLGIRRLEGESDAEYKRRAAATSERELDTKIRSGYFTKAPERFSPLGISDDATRMLGVRGGGITEMPIPAGYSKGSFPKVAEKGSAGVDIRKTDEGFIAFNKTTGKPVYNLGSKGQPLPIGVSESDLLTREKQAASAGIPLEMRSDPESGKLIIGYKGRDGNYYDSLEEARKAKPAKK